MAETHQGLVRAGGKLVLMGEYCVLDGGPALVMAIDRGVECRFLWGPALMEPSLPTKVLRGSRYISSDSPDQRFVIQALETVSAPAGSYAFRDWNPVPLAEKPGFGGSAAATVAAVIAGGAPGERAFEVHAKVQGSGSGIDVAASLHGGFLRFQRGEARTAPAPQTLPIVVFSGASSATGPRVRAWQAWRGDRAAVVARMTELVELFPIDPILAVREARLLLRDALASAGVLYESAALERIAIEAGALGGAARPSGAGGGDCALAWFHDPESASRFTERMERLSLPVLGYNIAGPARILPLDTPVENLES